MLRIEVVVLRLKVVYFYLRKVYIFVLDLVKRNENFLFERKYVF